MMRFATYTSPDWVVRFLFAVLAACGAPASSPPGPSTDATAADTQISLDAGLGSLDVALEPSAPDVYSSADAQTHWDVQADDVALDTGCAASLRLCGRVCTICPAGSHVLTTGCSSNRCIVLTCAAGYRTNNLELGCQDIDECQTANGGCVAPSVCVNTSGGSRCDQPQTLRWAQVNTPGPSARAEHAMAYDSVRQRVVLFGGFSAAQNLLGDTWEWNGASWTQVNSRGPAARSAHAMAYDSARQRVVLFGGFSSSSWGDTWEWNGSTWTQMASAGPSARYAHAMVYDSSRQRVVLYGGAPWNTNSEVWLWDGDTWRETNTQRNPPPSRHEAVMAFDSHRQTAVLFGGRTSPSTVWNDTWEFDSRWTPTVTVAPAARTRHTMAYDSQRERVVLFGGYNEAFEALNDTWEWYGATHTWALLPTPGPTSRSRHAMAYDSARQQVVLFGGHSLDAATRDDTTTWLFGVQ